MIRVSSSIGIIIHDSSVGGSSGFNPRVQIIDVVEHATADFEIREFNLFGARPLRRVIQDEIEDLLSQELLEGRMQSGDTMIIDVEGDKFVVSTKEVAALP